jgi:hypothetical protein
LIASCTPRRTARRVTASLAGAAAPVVPGTRAGDPVGVESACESEAIVFLGRAGDAFSGSRNRAGAAKPWARRITRTVLHNVGKPFGTS